MTAAVESSFQLGDVFTDVMAAAAGVFLLNQGAAVRPNGSNADELSKTSDARLHLVSRADEDVRPQAPVVTAGAAGAEQNLVRAFLSQPELFVASLANSRQHDSVGNADPSGA